LIGFVLRPTTVPRDTYRNIKETGYFTVNHIHSDIIEEAHHTSAKYPTEISEFSQTSLEEEYIDDFHAPFVKDARIKLGCKFLNEYEIKENDTLLLVSQIEHLYVADQNIQQDDGWLKLQNADTITINGLDGYAKTELIERFPYARPKKA
jgi:flavin reductase (DIM6/NTAB) family NADH-FMN oxidoreductase RutF